MQGFQPNNPIVPLNIAVKYDPPIIALFYKRNKNANKKHMYSIVLNDLVNLNDSTKISKKLYQEHSLYINENIIQFDQLQENVEKLLEHLRQQDQQDGNNNDQNQNDQLNQNDQNLDDGYYDFDYDDDNNNNNNNFNQQNNNQMNLQNIVTDNQVPEEYRVQQVGSPKQQNKKKLFQQMPNIMNKKKKKHGNFMQKQYLQQDQNNNNNEDDYYEVDEEIDENMNQQVIQHPEELNLDDDEAEESIENRDYGNYDQNFNNQNQNQQQNQSPNLDDYYENDQLQQNNFNIMDNQGFVFDNNNQNNNNNQQQYFQENQNNFGQDYEEDYSYNYDNSQQLPENQQQQEEEISYEPTIPQSNMRKSNRLGLLRDLSNQREMQNQY